MAKKIEDFKPVYYAIRWDWNEDRPKPFNIYNWCGALLTKEVRKYDNRPGKYKRYVRTDWETNESEYIYGWDAFVAEVNCILMYYFWAKCEHEMIVTQWPPRKDKETGDIRDYKLDVYEQLKPNVEAIARDLLYQYRQWKKNK